MDEAKEVIRLFMATLALDSEEECAEVAAQLGIEDGGAALWRLSRRADAILNPT